MVPVLDQSLSRYKWRDLDEAMGYLGAEASEKLRGMRDAAHLFPEGSELLHDYEHHKGQEVQLGAYRHFLPECGTERIALIAKVREKDSKEIPLFYVYAAMGLELQRDFQQMILAKCAWNAVGAAMVAAATALSGHEVCSLQ